MVDPDPASLASLPIPTYEEAISSRPGTSNSHLGPAESSDDAERQGLLAGDGGDRRDRTARYRPPTVESVGNSEDSLASLASTRSSDDSLRREVSQMEIEEPALGYGRGPSRIRDNLSKRITYLTQSLSSISLPFTWRLPSFASLRTRALQSPTPTLIIMGRLFALLLIFAVVYFFASEISLGRVGVRQNYDVDSVRAFIQRHVNEARLQATLQHLTDFDHVAGTEGDYWLAEYVENHFAAAHLDHMESTRYEVYLNYPRESGRQVKIVEPAEEAWTAQLEEDFMKETPNSDRKQTLVFHGHSMAGDVKGPLIYANSGSREDFETLKQLGVEVKGAVVLVRSGGSQPDAALKVRAAELAGAAGCLTYGDPKETDANRGQPGPEGRYMPKDGVQRDSVSLTSWVVGDVLTPGWASHPTTSRNSKTDSKGLVGIPSLPLSWRDAERLLRALKGRGKKVPADWIGGVPEGEEWWTGDRRPLVVQLTNEQDEVERRPIWNVLGTIAGIEQSEKAVVVGAHRDSWCLGAADGGSATAMLLEVATIFGELMKQGWRPLRTIQFASWDASTYNLIGSTEWVEENLPGLRLNGVAYLNVDAAVTGPDFRASASPVFHRALLRVLGRVTDPMKNQTLRELWEASNGKLETLRADSDYVPFQDIAGTSSIDVGFDGPGYPKHSCYDNTQWMHKFGDPDFLHHMLLTEVWALLILEIADQPVLPYDFEAYARSVLGYVANLKQDVAKKSGSDAAPPPLNLDQLDAAAQQFVDDATNFQRWEKEWQGMINSTGVENNVLAIQRMSHNSRMSNFETHLLDLEPGGGIPGRDQFKHILHGPPAWSDRDRAEFPAVRDAILENDWKGAQEQADKAAMILSKASRKLLN